jgi:2-polyprenyl-3-methyl-5-hydroxy-6-metoxy-1,4-benzoquinol methylase
LPLITSEYVALQRDLHRRFNYGYGVDTPEVVDILRVLRPAHTPFRVLDYGCGQGSLKKALEADPKMQPYALVWEYDPAIKGKTEVPDRGSAFVVCADVLEHIEPECLPDVLKHLADCTLDTCIMIIATSPSNKVMKDGRQAHICLMTAAEWRAALSEHFLLGVFEDRTKRGKGILAIGRPHAQI